MLQTLAQDIRESSLHDAETWLHLPTLLMTSCSMLLRMHPFSLKQLMCLFVWVWICVFYALSMPFVFMFTRICICLYGKLLWVRACESLSLPLCCCIVITHNCTFILFVPELHVESISQVPELKIPFIFSLEELFLTVT